MRYGYELEEGLKRDLTPGGNGFPSQLGREYFFDLECRMRRIERLYPYAKDIVGITADGAPEALALTPMGAESVPVIWAPGQGIVEYPGSSGVPLMPRHRVVVQVHYNLADDPGAVTDRSIVHLRLASSVENVGVFMLDDPFLNTLFEDTPAALEPGQESVKYTWNRDVSEYFGDLPDVKLYGVMPHMHERGRKYRLNIGAANDMGCGIDVQAWDFHWQRMYFYTQPLAVNEATRIEVTCDFDTSAETEPVLPGWGTRNEMCLATLYFTMPASALGL